MATYTAVYTGSFGMNSAGTNGRSTTLHGDAIESGKKIISISYTINMSAGGYSSGDYWKVHEFQIAGGPYASAKNVRMTGTRGTVSGEMTFSQSHISAFGGSCSLHAKVNTTHSSTSYMGDVTVTVYYTDDTSSGSSSSSSPSSSSIGTITTDKTSVAAGEEIKFTLPRISSSSEKYWITQTLGEKKIEQELTSGVYEKTILIPMEWCEAMPNATSAIASAKIERKSGSAVSASGTKSFMVTVPQDVKPTANALTWERTTGEGFPSGFDSVHIQNRTGISMTASAEGVYGSTIVSYTFTCKKGVKTLASATQTGTNAATYTINPITSAGELTFLVRATDSRGRKSEEKSISLNVLEYHLPIFQTISAYRCDASGIATEEGTYIHASATVNAADIAEGEITNSLELGWAYRRHGDEEWIDSEESKAAVSTEEDRVFGGGQIDPLYTYQVRLTATDRFGSVSRTVNVSTATCSLFILEGGNGIGLGKICENENSVEINPNWQLRCGDFTFHPVYFGRTAPNNPCEGLVWLQPKE